MVDAPEPDRLDRYKQSAYRRWRALDLTASFEVTDSNGEAETFDGNWVTSFTKGLPHDEFGIVEEGAFTAFREAVNARGVSTLFEAPRGIGPSNPPRTRGPDGPWSWRGWRSPRAGHVYDLEGPDAGSVAMPPAPMLGSDELAAEMAEVYAAALLRDTPFERIRSGDRSANELAQALGGMAWFRKGAAVVDADGTPADDRAQARRAVRFGPGGRFDAHCLMRGSSPGCMAGPHVSQFLLRGTGSLRGGPDGPTAGRIRFGAQGIDQRIETHTAQGDYLVDWADWLDVQNGADTSGLDGFEAERRFVLTPRDLAAYGHFDMVYQAYLNAALILLAEGAKGDRGFPEQGGSQPRAPFVTFGAPHVLTLVAEGASRAMKAAFRQKFNYHLRARPEALGALASLSVNGHGAKLGAAEDAAHAHVRGLATAILPDGRTLMERVCARNVEIGAVFSRAAPPKSPPIVENLLLPLAFPEGAPMEPSYGSGHAAAAGACVTMLKAFFEMFNGPDSWEALPLSAVGRGEMTEVFVADPATVGATLKDVREDAAPLTLEGELNKLAANISLGRVMAGVHFFSDYYESLRLGERIAIGILKEQMATYPEPVRMRFRGFDGQKVTLATRGEPDTVTLTIEDPATT